MRSHDSAAAATRDAYPPGVPCWVDVEAPDPLAAAAFYGELFGWELEDRVPAHVPGHYFVARLDGLVVAAIVSLDDPGLAPAWRTFVCVESADASAARVVDAGGRIVEALSDAAAAGRMAVCADPDGATFVLWEPRERKGAELVNAPGAWNWSDLHAPDAERAKAFYGAVFGWRLAPVAFGDASMWQQPGYGDLLAERDPDLRRRHAADGVPDGFSDAIGWFAPSTDVPARWTVTFSVADVDAVAATAGRLGGSVVTEPYDAGGVARVAVLADPHGAAFTVSAYDPG